MKLAVAVAGEKALPSAFVVWRGLIGSIVKAAEYGYHGIELALKTAEEVDVHLLDATLQKNNMAVSCISTGQVFADLGLSFTHPDQFARKQLIAVFSDLIDLAGYFGCLLNIGRVRGFVAAGESEQTAAARFIATAQPLCERAAQKNVTLILEPVNRYEINFINSLDQGAKLLTEAGLTQMGLMPDVFHMNIEDDQIGASLIRNAPWIRYIHLADSNRLAPGWGHIDFDEVFASLLQIHFSGWASIEILPEPDADRAALQAARFVLPRIAAYNRSINEEGRNLYEKN